MSERPKLPADWQVCVYKGGWCLRRESTRRLYMLEGRNRAVAFETKRAAQLWAEMLNEREAAVSSD